MMQLLSPRSLSKISIRIIYFKKVFSPLFGYDWYRYVTLVLGAPFQIFNTSTLNTLFIFILAEKVKSRSEGINIRQLSD